MSLAERCPNLKAQGFVSSSTSGRTSSLPIRCCRRRTTCRTATLHQCCKGSWALASIGSPAETSRSSIGRPTLPVDVARSGAPGPRPRPSIAIASFSSSPRRACPTRVMATAFRKSSFEESKVSKQITKWVSLSKIKSSPALSGGSLEKPPMTKSTRTISGRRTIPTATTLVTKSVCHRTNWNRGLGSALSSRPLLALLPLSTSMLPPTQLPSALRPWRPRPWTRRIPVRKEALSVTACSSVPRPATLALARAETRIRVMRVPFQARPNKCWPGWI
mmetsp:Transcript_107564/g.302825  ORF Transcript_107564/g.302825 Transcript_107564/m.302825 type:complete len:276 (+) Transcript_107564:559-1386(+)